MKRATKNILYGIGSLVDIMPSDTFRKSAARQHAANDVASHFVRVGMALKDACNKFENDAKVSPIQK